MKSAFSEDNFKEPIFLAFKFENNEIHFKIEEEEKPILKWNRNGKLIIKNREPGSSLEEQKLFKETSNEAKRIWDDFFLNGEITDKEKKLEDLILYTASKLGIEKSEFINTILFNEELANFFIYQPENSFLRKIEEEGQIQPLGVKGEGLFNTLQIFSEYKDYGPKTIEEIKNILYIIEWFDDLEIKYDKDTGRKALLLKDRNLPDGIYLNQYSVNEGFLYLLFYISLFISNETPAFFGIDNIEASFHPKLCTDMITKFVELSKIHNKQVIVTTHNPFILDGLDLNDPEQRLFVVDKNPDGETIAHLIDKPLKHMKLSEGWMRGVIGGNPTTVSG
jgi:predicted ATPase